MENKNLLKMAVEGQKLSKADKDELRAMFAQYGVKVKKNGCSNCWADAAAEYMAAAKADANARLEGAQQKSENVEQKPKAEYILKEGTRVRFLGMLITPETMDDEFAKRLLSLGFPLLYFSKYPK